MVNLTPTTLKCRTPKRPENDENSCLKEERRIYQTVSVAQTNASLSTVPVVSTVSPRGPAAPSTRTLCSDSSKRPHHALGEVDPNVLERQEQNKSVRPNGAVLIIKCLPEDLLSLKRGDHAYIMCSAESVAYQEVCGCLSFENRIVDSTGKVSATNNFSLP